MPISIDSRPASDRANDSKGTKLKISPWAIAAVVVAILFAVYAFNQSSSYSKNAEQLQSDVAK